MNLTKGIHGYGAGLFGLYLFASLFAFWPRYLSDPAGVAHVSVHVHALLMGLWLVMLRRLPPRRPHLPRSTLVHVGGLPGELVAVLRHVVCVYAPHVAASIGWPPLATLAAR